MPTKIDYTGIIKVPVIIAIVVAVARFALEASGASTVVSMVFGVAWLHMLFPILLCKLSNGATKNHL